MPGGSSGCGADRVGRRGAQYSFTLYNEDGRRIRGTEVATLAFESEAEAARWAAALAEAVFVLRARVRAI